jgi:hypothetical protein
MRTEIEYVSARISIRYAAHCDSGAGGAGTGREKGLDVSDRIRCRRSAGGSKVEEVRREATGMRMQPLEGCPKVTSLEQELANLKDEIRVMNPKPDPFTPLPNVAAPATPAQKCLGSSLPPLLRPEQ